MLDYVRVINFRIIIIFIIIDCDIICREHIKCVLQIYVVKNYVVFFIIKKYEVIVFCICVSTLLI